MNENKIILVGGGGHCKSVIDVIEQEGKYIIAGILDLKEFIGHKVLNYPVIGDDNDIDRLSREYTCFHISLGFIKDPKRRIEIFKELKSYNLNLPVVCSPRAFVSPHADIGEGTVIMHNAQVNAGARVGKNCIINSRALIEHDAVIGDHCHISTGAIVNGNAEIGEASFIGSGAIAIQGAKVPSNSFIRAGKLFV